MTPKAKLSRGARAEKGSEWAFDLRTNFAFSDSEGSDTDEPPISKPEVLGFIAELDLSSRQENVSYRPNPFSIAKINAAQRKPGLQIASAQGPSAPGPSSARPQRQTTGQLTITDAFKAKASKASVIPKKPGFKARILPERPDPTPSLHSYPNMSSRDTAFTNTTDNTPASFRRTPVPSGQTAAPVTHINALDRTDDLPALAENILTAREIDYPSEDPLSGTGATNRIVSPHSYHTPSNLNTVANLRPLDVLHVSQPPGTGAGFPSKSTNIFPPQPRHAHVFPRQAFPPPIKLETSPPLIQDVTRELEGTRAPGLSRAHIFRDSRKLPPARPLPSPLSLAKRPPPKTPRKLGVISPCIKSKTVIPKGTGDAYLFATDGADEAWTTLPSRKKKKSSSNMTTPYVTRPFSIPSLLPIISKAGESYVPKPRITMYLPPPPAQEIKKFTPAAPSTPSPKPPAIIHTKLPSFPKHEEQTNPLSYTPPIKYEWSSSPLKPEARAYPSPTRSRRPQLSFVSPRADQRTLPSPRQGGRRSGYRLPSPPTSDPPIPNNDDDLQLHIDPTEIRLGFQKTRGYCFKHRHDRDKLWDILGLESCGRVFRDDEIQMDDDGVHRDAGEIQIAFWPRLP